MRRLLLLRHAKAERASTGGGDLERVLTRRGRADAQKLGAYLVRNGLTPGLALVSTSARTRETWNLVAGEFAEPAPARFEQRLYGAGPDVILQSIQAAASAVATLLVVGHNPGIQEIAATLVAAGDIEGVRQISEDFPTTALAVIDFAIGDWGQTRIQSGRLNQFVVPKSLAATPD
jgi:phosphohistidine phosphatase